MSTIPLPLMPLETLAAVYLSHCLPGITGFHKYGGWSATACMIADIVTEIFCNESAHVLECGSGLTTLFCAGAFQKLGRGKVYSLEHDPSYWNRTMRLLSRNGLSDNAEVVLAPLVPVTVFGRDVHWYDLDVLPSGYLERAELMIVDGPPQALSSGRIGAWHLFSRTPNLRCVYLDDVHTPEAQQTLHAWKQAGLAYSDRRSRTPDQSQYIRMESIRMRTTATDRGDG